MKLRYKKFPTQPTSTFPDTKFFFRPIIPIRISYKGRSIKYEGLLDSGSDFCLLHAEIGEFLKIPIIEGKQEQFGGIVDHQTTAYFHHVDITIQGNRYKNIPVGFSYDIAPHGFGILGHHKFFNLFKIILDVQKEQIELKEKV